MGLGMLVCLGTGTLSMRTFACSGPLRPTGPHLFAAPRKEELAALLHAVQNRETVMLYGPRQSGKTTLVHAVHRQLEATDVPVLYISLQASVDPATLTTKEAWRVVNCLMAAAAGIPDGGGYDMAYAMWLGQVVAAGLIPAPVVILDDIDVLFGCPPTTRDTILHGLRAFATPSFEHRHVRGIILCGPHKITTLAMSNPDASLLRVSTRVPMSPFTVPETSTWLSGGGPAWPCPTRSFRPSSLTQVGTRGGL